MLYTLFFFFIFIGYLYRNLLIYYFVYFYDKYKKYLEYINSRKITLDYVDNYNMYHTSKYSLKEIKKLQKFKYVILNINNKKFIINDLENFDIDIEKLRNRTKVDNCIICSNVSITNCMYKLTKVLPVEYDLHEELSKFLVNDYIINLEQYKDLWISLLNKKNGTVYNTEYELEWTIINAKLEKYNSKNITIKIIDNLIHISN